MVTTEVCRNIINIIGKYINPISAQFLVENYCSISNISIENFLISDVPKFIIYIAKERDNFPKINDQQFEKLLKDLVYLSNSSNDTLNKDLTIRYRELADMIQ